MLNVADSYNISAVGFYPQANSIAVYTTDMSQVNQSAIKSACGFDAIEFFKGGDVISADPVSGDKNSGSLNTDAVTQKANKSVYSGEWLKGAQGTTLGWSSVTTSAVKDYGKSTEQKGFLTCGHGWKVGDTAKIGNTTVGKVTYVFRNTYTDVAFIKSSLTQTLLTLSGKYIKSRGDAISGETVYLIGANGEQKATVKFVELDFPVSGRTKAPTYSGENHEMCFSFNKTPIPGDSGGALIAPISGGNYKISGTNIGYFADSEDGVAGQWSYIESCGILPSRLN